MWPIMLYWHVQEQNICNSLYCSIVMRLNMLMLTKIKIMLFRKTIFCFGEITCWSRELKSRDIKGLLTVSEIRDATPFQFPCHSAAGECLTKRRVGSQQHESCHTQDDTHFLPDIHDSRQPRSYLYAQKYPSKRTRLPYYVSGETPH